MARLVRNADVLSHDAEMDLEVLEYIGNLQYDWELVLRADIRVERILEHPLTWTYRLSGVKRRYSPPFLVSYLDEYKRWTCLYEVQSIEALRQNWRTLRPAYKTAIHAIKSRGWRFQIITERDFIPEYIENLRFLRRYQNLPMQEMHHQALLYTFQRLGETTPKKVIEEVWNDEEKKYAAIAEMWRMLACGELSIFPLQKLTMASTIWLSDFDEE